MTASKKKLYAALMSLGGAAMLVDRLIIGAPGPLDVPASAIAAMVRPAVDTADLAPATPQASAIPALAFPRGLPRADLQGSIRDYFAPPHLPQPVPEPAPSGPGAENQSELSHTAFAAQFRLQAVLWSDGLRIAVIADRWHREGDTISGCRIATINDREVRVICFDGDARLEIGTMRTGMPH